MSVYDSMLLLATNTGEIEHDNQQRLVQTNVEPTKGKEAVHYYSQRWRIGLHSTHRKPHTIPHTTKSDRKRNLDTGPNLILLVLGLSANVRIF